MSGIAGRGMRASPQEALVIAFRLLDAPLFLLLLAGQLIRRRRQLEGLALVQVDDRPVLPGQRLLELVLDAVRLLRAARLGFFDGVEEDFGFARDPSPAAELSSGVKFASVR